ncbi:energy transducer TonB [Hyphobacterium sp.]|uniref:energy transducer TonB n=1 Tax=Hyphobacterium sp. TaxID=2004662 RepID=UPI003BA8598F
MQRILRTTISLPLAGLITLSLAAFMSGLIRVEGTPNTDTTELTLDLFPRVELVEPASDLDMTDISRIDPPPPLPTIDVEAASRPDDGLEIVVGGIPDFGETVIQSSAITWNATDRETNPMVRIAPVYPPRALERGIEGYCTMNFDIGPDGVPINIRASYCTSGMFERNSVRAMERWRYSPRIVDGNPVVQRNLTTQIDFQIAD